MKDFTKNIKLLYESLFDNDDSDNIILNDEDDTVLSKYVKNNLDNVLINLLGIKKPKAWVKHIDHKSNNEWLEFYKDGTFTSAYVDNVEKILLQKGFIKYTSFEYTYAFNTGKLFTYDDFRDYLQKKLWFQTEFRIQEKFTEFNKWYLNNWQRYPSNIQNMFLNDPTLKKVYMSQDEGIILTVQNPFYSDDSRTFYSKSVYIKAILKLTGNILYSELDNKELKDKVLSHKDDEKKITFLKKGFRNACKSNTKIFNRILEYKINDKGYPYGITYFSWNGNPKIVKRRDGSKIKIPLLLQEMLSTGFHFLNELEKTDETATYELTNKSILLKIYKYTDCSNVNNGNKIYSGKPDSYIKIELDDYLLSQYKQIFNIKG